MMWKWRHGRGGKRRVGESLLDGGTVEHVESGEMSDKGLGMIRNRIQVRTLKLGFGVDIMLGKGSGVVGMKRGVVTEGSIGDDVCADRIMSLWAYGSDHTCRPDVDGFPYSQCF